MVNKVDIEVEAKDIGFERTASQIVSFERKLKQVSKAHTVLGNEFARGKMSVQQYELAVSSLNDELKQTQTDMYAMGTATSFSEKKLRRIKAGVQNASYQFADFAVQIQGGQNALVALGQQGSQFLAIFGPAGAIAGAALAIGTAIIGPMLKAGKAAEGVTNIYRDLAKAMFAVSPAAQAMKGLLVEELAIKEEIARLNQVFVDTGWSQAELIEIQGNLLDANLVRQENIDEVVQKGLIRQIELQKEAQEAQEAALGIIHDAQVEADLVSGKFGDWTARLFEANKELLTTGEEISTFGTSIENVSSATVAWTTNLASTYAQVISLGEAIKNLDPNRLTGGTIAWGSTDNTINQGIAENEAKAAEAAAKAAARAGKKKPELTEWEKELKKQIERTQELMDEFLADQEAAIKEFSEAIGEPMKGFFDNLISGTMSVEDAFKQMIFEMISNVYDLLVLQPLIDNLMNSLTGAGGGFGGGIMDMVTGILSGFSDGGFTGAGGKHQTAGIVHKGEYVMPQEAVKRIGLGNLRAMHKGEPMAVPNVSGGAPSSRGPGDSGQVVNNYYSYDNRDMSVRGNGDAFLDSKIAKQLNSAAPKIIRASTQAVISERRRGGTMKAAFG